jgi:hypothetical protein
MRSSLVAAVMSVTLVVPGALRAAPMSADVSARALVARPLDPPVTAKPTPRAPLGGTAGTPTIGPHGIPGSTLSGERRAGARIAAESLVVEKSLRRLTLWQGGLPVRTYDIALGSSPVGAKEQAGDNRTPEGLYHIDARNPKSRFHLGLHVSYPNAQDVARARAQGVAPGGDIMLHGLPPKQSDVGPLHRAYDWTNGCVALTDAEIEEVFAAVPVGTPIRFLP